MKRKNRIQDSLNENLSGLYLSQQQHAILMHEITGGKKVKTKMKTSLVLVLVLVLLAAVAVAVGLNYHYSAEVTAKSVARDAVMEQYGLSRDAMDMFWAKAENSAQGTTVRFTYYDGVDEVSPQMGVYTVEITPDGQTTVQWTHDDVDPATWEDGSLDSEVWGDKQILAYRAKRDQENQLIYDSVAANVEADKVGTTETSSPTPALRGKLDKAQVHNIAADALKATFGFTDDTLTLFESYTGLGGTEAQALDSVRQGMYDIPDELQTLLDSYADAGKQEGDVWAIVYHPTLVADIILRTEGQNLLGNYVVTISDETGTVMRTDWSLVGQAEATYTEQTWGQASAFDAEMLPWALDLVNICAPLLIDENGDVAGMPTGAEDKAAYDQAFRDAGFDATRYNHVLPEAGDIPYEEAVEIVAQVLYEECGVSREVFDASGFAYADLTQEEDRREWYFWVQNAEEQCGWTVVFDAQTGEVLYVDSDPFANSNG